MSVKDIIATIPKEVPQQEEEFDLQKILQNVPEEGYDCKGKYYKKILLGKAKNYTNIKQGMLLPLFRVVVNNNYREGKWLCLCNCGRTIVINSKEFKKPFNHSCGCAKGNNNWSAKNLTGKRFSRLLVIKRNKDYPKENNLNSKGYWDCLCDCGKIITVQTHNLTSGNTKSCGCYRANLIRLNKLKDLTNEIIGHLLVLELDEEGMKNRPKEYTGAIWLCQCECGNIISVRSQNLINESTISCGCIKNKSAGEDKIYTILEKNNIKFLFDSCYFKDLIVNKETKSLGRYDFIILNEELKPIRLIEYDGETHYEDTNFFKRAIPLETRKKYDEIKNEYAKQHNIPLVRIPYWEKKNITLEMLMGDQYLVT